MSYTCPKCGQDYSDENSYLDHLPCGRLTVADEIMIFTGSTLYGAPHITRHRTCDYCGNRRPKDPCPHCGRW